MTSLKDIARATETVTLGEHEVQCRGISGTALLSLLTRFPALGTALWKGGEALSGNGEISAAGLLKEAPQAVAAILAAGKGSPDDPEEEEAAASLPLEYQVTMLAAILRCTLPSGFGPFVEKLTAMFGGVPRLLPIGSAESAQPLPNGHAVTDTTSPSPLSS